MGEIDFFKGKSFDELATVDDNGDLINGGRSVNQIISDSNAQSGVPLRYSEVRFSDYNSKFVTDEKIISTVEKFKSFCIEPDTDKIFGICGPTGSGKTTLTCCGIHERAINGMSSGLFLSCRTLKPMIMTSRSFKATESEYDIYKKYMTTPFLVIDELGKCSDEQLEWEFFTTVIAGRYDNKLRTVFTTNLDYGKLKAFIMNNGNKGEDIYDRIKSVLIAETLVSESHR